MSVDKRNARAYDERGNVRPADERFLGKGQRVPRESSEGEPRTRRVRRKDNEDK